MNSLVFQKTLLSLGLGVLAPVVYFFFVRPALSSQTASRIEIAALAGLAALILIGLLAAGVSLLREVFGRSGLADSNTLANRATFLFSAVAVLAAFLAASQWTAHTPPILGADGNPLPGSIATMEKVRLGGENQWLIIRGQDVTKPVLLFLSGGPGASEAARVLRFNQDLEKDFVVVIWEQRGCGKSYPARANLTVEQYTSDVIELSEMLRERFDEEKIFLIGHSWGTIIGVRAAQTRPDLFHAYVGTAQMVDVLETDRMIYQLMLDHARATNDTAFVKTLETQGVPPYLGSNPVQPYATLFGREYAVYEVPNIKSEEYRRDGDILLLMLKQPEYGWLDRVYYLLGLMTTFNEVYPQLQQMDFRQDAIRLDLPVYLVLGRHDMNNPSSIPEEYFSLLQAPRKQLIFFEDSGHGMIWEEAALFHNLMVEHVLAESELE